jgi:hypothetical protein
MRRKALFTAFIVAVVATAMIPGSATATDSPDPSAIETDGAVEQVASQESGNDPQWLSGVLGKIKTLIIDRLAVQLGPLAFAVGFMLWAFGKSGNMVQRGSKLMLGGAGMTVIGVSYKMLVGTLKWLGSF